MAQVWGVLLAVVLMLAAARRWRAAVALALPATALSAWVVPHLIPAQPHAPTRTLRIAYANVNAWNAPDAEAVEWFASTDADVVALVECSAAWADALRAAARGGSPIWPHSCIRIDDHPIGGVALLSRHPLRAAQSTVSPVGRFPLVDAVVEAPAGPLRILAAHPVPPVGFGAVEMRNAEIRWLAQRGAEAEEPAAIVADFNETPFGSALREFRERSGMTSAASVSGLVTSWPARAAGVPWPAPLRIAIDHCFVSPGVGIAGFSRGPDIGSDHLPLLIDISHGMGGG